MTHPLASIFAERFHSAAVAADKRGEPRVARAFATLATEIAAIATEEPPGPSGAPADPAAPSEPAPTGSAAQKERVG